MIDKTYEQWLAEHPLTYPDGPEIMVGDWVDFGFDPRTIGADPIERDWHGQVVRFVGTDVVVDTFLNSHQRFAPTALTFMGRGAYPMVAIPVETESKKGNR